MTHGALQDNAVIGHHWVAEIADGGYRLVLNSPDLNALDRACRDLLWPAVRLDYWELTFEGFEEDGSEVWLLSPVLG